LDKVLSSKRCSTYHKAFAPLRTEIANAPVQALRTQFSAEAWIDAKLEHWHLESAELQPKSEAAEKRQVCYFC